MSCGHGEDAGAWVLGALPDDERERFAAHLPGCEACRREVAELQMVADTLPLAAQQIAPPPELKERIMATVRAEAAVLRAAGPEADEAPAAPAAGEPAPAPGSPKAARSDRPGWRASFSGRLKRPMLALRPVTVAVAAAVLVATGIGVGALLSGGGPSGRTVQAQVVAPRSPAARASLVIDDAQRATLEVRGFPSPPSGRVYQVWLKRPGQAPDPTNALFDVRSGSATVRVPGSVRGVEQVLVTDEPQGGSRAPTRAPVIIAQPA